jgi:hypothetical protein
VSPSRWLFVADVFRLEEWLREAGITPSKIPSTAKALRENDFDDSAMLARITADDLKECGITSVGIRKCILETVRGDTNVEDVKYGMCTSLFVHAAASELDVTCRTLILAVAPPVALPTLLVGYACDLFYFLDPCYCLLVMLGAAPIASPPRVRRISSFSPMSPPPLIEVPASIVSATDPNFVEYQVLSCCGSKDFELARCVAAGQNGIVFAARCLRKGLPRPMKLFAVKLVFNFGLSTAATRNTFENEFNVLSRLPPHSNITRFWTQFVDEVGQACFRCFASG